MQRCISVLRNSKTSKMSSCLPKFFACIFCLFHKTFDETFHKMFHKTFRNNVSGNITVKQQNAKKYQNRELQQMSRYQTKVFDKMVDLCFAKQQNIRKSQLFRKKLCFFLIPAFYETNNTKCFAKW
jgi:hypothetical protein